MSTTANAPYAKIPKELLDTPNWVVWKKADRDGKVTKLPFDAKTNLMAASNKPETWSDFKTASDAAPWGYDGVGFMLVGTNFVGVDFDGVIDGATGEVDPFVQNILKQLGNPYSEITPSGSGIRCFVRCDNLHLDKGKKFSNGEHYGVEIYSGADKGRYLTVTGNQAGGEGIPLLTHEQIEIPYFLISQFRNSNLRTLWLGDASTNQNDASRADLALCNELVKLLGHDKSRIDRFFRVSKLMRPKWEREDYRNSTLDKALARKTAVAATATQVQDPEPADIHTIQIPDMAESVLVGRLGELYDTHLRKYFPISFAWLTLVTIAGMLVPEPEHIRTNFYSALVGPVHVGKTQCIEWVLKMLGLNSPILMRVNAGSGESLSISRLSKADGQSRLLFVDELAHLLAKSQIEGASFPFLLNQAYYSRTFEVIASRGKEVNIHCNLSIIGGIVEQSFDTAFGAASVGGLYDRFALAQAPTGFQFDYRPCPADQVLYSDSANVSVNPEVWEAKSDYVKRLGLNPRVFEIGLKVAAVCAAIDGRPVLQSSDLLPVLPFVQYQTDARKILQPNAGENVDGILASKFLNYIERHGGHDGWLEVRTMLRSTHAYDFGVGYQRVLDGLERGGEIDQHGRGVKGQKHLIRRIVAPQNV